MPQILLDDLLIRSFVFFQFFQAGREGNLFWGGFARGEAFHAFELIFNRLNRLGKICSFLKLGLSGDRFFQRWCISGLGELLIQPVGQKLINLIVPLLEVVDNLFRLSLLANKCPPRDIWMGDIDGISSKSFGKSWPLAHLPTRPESISI